MKKSVFSSLLAITFWLAGQETAWAQHLPLRTNLNDSKSASNFRYIALGSSLSSGVRDGGLTQQSQNSSFPYLIAKQLKINGFRQALFDDINKNGTGTQTVSLQGEILQFSPVTDNTLDDSKSETKLPKVKGELDNWAIPYLKAANLSVREAEPGAFLPLFEKKQYRHLNRLVDGQEGQITYTDLVREKIGQADLFSLEIGMHDFISYYSSGGYGQSISFMTYPREGHYVEGDLLAFLKGKGMKGVVLNVPDVTQFPFYQFYSYKKISTKQGASVYVERYHKNDVRLADPRDLFIPSEGVANLLKESNSVQRGLTKEKPLLDQEVIGWEEIADVSPYNHTLQRLAQENGFPIVDLYSLYKKIG